MIKVIDNQFNFIGAVDNYISFLPSRSFYGIGNFELHLQFTKEMSDILVDENILFLDSENPYIILHKEIKSDDGMMIIKGQQLKHYLSRWITKPPTGIAYHRINDNAETIIKTFVEENCLTPDLIIADDLKRGSKLIFQTRYKNLAEEIGKIGLTVNLGWIVKLDLINNKYIFDVVESIDRTAEQDINNRALFSNDFDNVNNQELVQSKLGYGNVAYVAGQGEGASREIDIVGNETGFNRYEVFVDARDIENANDLEDRGIQKLAEMGKVLSFDTEILTNSNLIYRQDYDLGDKVTIQNKEWNIILNTVITDIDEIYEQSGFRITATFGNATPTFGQSLSMKLDSPIYEGGSGGTGGNIDGGKPSTEYGGYTAINGGGVDGD